MDKLGFTHSGIPSPYIKQLTIIILDNVHNYSKKRPTVYSGTSLNTETIKMPQLKTHPQLQSKDKKWTPLYIGVESSLFSTEVYYTTEIGHNLTKKELDHMVNTEKDASVKIEGNK